VVAGAARGGPARNSGADGMLAANRLDNIQLFASLAPEERRNLEKRCRWRRYRSNEQILDKDSDDHDVYFVAEGQVQIVNYSMTGREIALARLQAGSFFGELAAIDGQPRSASVVAVEPCLLASASPSLFIDLVTRYPGVARGVLAKLCGIVRSCDERIMDLSTLGAVQRVYLELLRLGREDASGQLLIAKLPTHKTIASRASTTRETVARSISQLTAANIMAKHGDGLLVRDREKLEKLAGALAGELGGDLSR